MIFEVRPSWINPDEKTEFPIAKTSWVQSKQVWKVFWMRSDLKWHKYDPVPEVKTLDEFLTLVIQDKHACFWG
ncbi:MAG: DUF3024 domain-containing protein [Bacteroidota bacterium]